MAMMDLYVSLALLGGVCWALYKIILSRKRAKRIDKNQALIQNFIINGRIHARTLKLRRLFSATDTNQDNCEMIGRILSCTQIRFKDLSKLNRAISNVQNPQANPSTQSQSDNNQSESVVSMAQPIRQFVHQQSVAKPVQYQANNQDDLTNKIMTFFVIKCKDGLDRLFMVNSDKHSRLEGDVTTTVWNWSEVGGIQCENGIDISNPDMIMTKDIGIDVLSRMDGFVHNAILLDSKHRKQLRVQGLMAGGDQ